MNQRVKETLLNPYSTYENLRAKGNIYYGKLFRYTGWYVTGHKEITEILKHTAFQTRLPIPTLTEKYIHLKNVQEHMLLFQNNINHRRLRLLINQAFTPNMLKQNISYMEKIAYNLLHQHKNRGQLDIVNDYALPFASFVIAKILGVLKKTGFNFVNGHIALVQTIDFAVSRTTIENGENLIAEIVSYFQNSSEQKRQNLQKI